MRQYSLDRLKSMPEGKSNTPKEINAINIDELNGFEIIADSKVASDKKKLVYQVMLFKNNGGYYIFVGSAIDKFDSYLAKFKSIAKSFKRK